MAATTLLLNNDDIEKVFDLNVCLGALREAYRAHATGQAVVGDRSQNYVPLAAPDLSYCVMSMHGSIYASGYMVLRMTSDVISEERVNGVPRREKLPRGPGGTYCGLIVVFDVNDLAPVAILHDGFLQLYRVACTSALSVKVLARDDAGDLALLGSSGQAWAHLAGMNAVCKLRSVRVFSPNAERCRAFVERAQRELHLAATGAATARAAIEGADLVVAATNASKPILDGAWIAPGAHVISIVSGDIKTQRRELDNETMRRAAVVVSHAKQIAMAQNQGDLAEPVKAGILKWEDIHDLSEHIAGTAPGRTKRDDITVFKNNVGTGLQFAAVAPPIYERARSAGIGRALPAEWFLQELKS